MDRARWQSYRNRYPALSLIGATPLFEVRVFAAKYPHSKVEAKAEWFNPGGSIKDRPVERMLLEAVESGELTPERTVIDSSSGNAGIAYAMIGKILGIPVELVIPGNASKERLKRIRAHGAQVVLTDPIEGYDAALREAHRRSESDTRKYYMPDQYANRNNWLAHYESTAGEILEQTGGRLTHFVAGVGTGGTITGVGRRLKESVPGVEVVSILPETFPGIEGLKPLEGEHDIIPEIYDDSVVDWKVKVKAEEAYDLCHELAGQGVFVGQSSGAYLAGVRAVLAAEPTARVVTVFSDIGERYFSTGLWD